MTSVIVWLFITQSVVFAWRSFLLFRLADRIVSVYVVCLRPVNIADGREPQKSLKSPDTWEECKKHSYRRQEKSVKKKERRRSVSQRRQRSFRRIQEPQDPKEIQFMLGVYMLSVEVSHSRSTVHIQPDSNCNKSLSGSVCISYVFPPVHNLWRLHLLFTSR